MRYSYLLVCLFIAQVTSQAATSWRGISSEISVPATCTTVSQTSSETVLFFRVEGFELRSTEGENSRVSVSAPGCSAMLESGSPDLPKMAASVIIPDGVPMQVEILSSSYRDYQDIDIAPSKGNLYRNQNPASIKSFDGPWYSRDEFFPAAMAYLREPYVLRDFSGQTVVVHPFHYNPVTRTLRVYFAMTVKVKPLRSSVVQHRQSLPVIDAAFAPIYANHFVNYNSFNYTPLIDQGRMLVLSDSMFIDQLRPFISWKNKCGQFTEVVDINTVGHSPSQIKAYVENYYLTYGLTFLLLVGDGAQIPPYNSSNGDSDPSYGYILGNDAYAEVFVGRFSANDSAELATQIIRSVNYERSPVITDDWFSKGICVASNQGPGDDNEFDFEHARLMRQDLMNYQYSLVDELYDGSQGGADSSGNPTALDLVHAINDGRGLITYTGHGSTTGCGTTGFNLYNLQQLTNGNRLPFFWSVACVNGNFVNTHCLAEGLLRATDSTGAPTGAVATLMSTINQSWDPPMDGQDEMVDLLVESYPANIQRTFGGLSVNGCMHMIDQYGSAGVEMTDTWTCFGDPSLHVRTASPAELLVTHPLELDVTSTGFLATVSRDSAMLCLTLRDSIVATATSLAGSASFNYGQLFVGDTLELTATAFNCLPYVARIPVVAINTGISSLFDLSGISVFPNPTLGRIQVNIMVPVESYLRIELLSASGQTVRVLKSLDRTSVGKHSYDFELNELTAGVYQLSVTTTAGKQVRSVIKQ